MPLVRIDVPGPLNPQQRQDLGEAVYQSLLSALNVPKDDRFVVIHEHSASTLQLDKTYLGIDRSDQAMVIQVTLRSGRSLEMKKAFYAEVARRMVALGRRAEDITISLVEVGAEDWSFGKGLASYA